MILFRDLLSCILRHRLMKVDINARYMTFLIDAHGKAVELFERRPFPENLSQSLALVHEILSVRAMIEEHFILISQQPDLPESGIGRDFHFIVFGEYGNKRIDDVFGIFHRYLNLAFLPTVHAGCLEFHGAIRLDFEEFLLITWLSDNTVESIGPQPDFNELTLEWQLFVRDVFAHLLCPLRSSRIL